jgi:hypothetical protein
MLSKTQKILASQAPQSPFAGEGRENPACRIRVRIGAGETSVKEEVGRGMRGSTGVRKCGNAPAARRFSPEGTSLGRTGAI